MRILEAKTIKSALFKSLFEALKLVLTEGNLVFTPEGMKLVAIESNKMALVHLFIQAESFEVYHCTERQVLGVDIQTMYRCIKSVSSKDILTFFLDDTSPNHLGISMENLEKGSFGRYQISLKKLREFTVNDALTFDTPPPEVASNVFQKICRDMQSHGTNIVEIKSLRDHLIFSAKDGDALHEVTLNVGTESDAPRDSSEIVQNTFLLKFLVLFSKASHLSPRVKICLKNDLPLVLEYAITGIGSLRYLLTPTEQTKM